jgi:hypothetical protein
MLPVPSWVHPVWLVCAGVLTLVVARRVVGLRWTATLLAGTYLGYRAVMWLLLTSTGFPPSVPPVMLLAGAVGVDLAVTRRLPGWLAAVPVTAAVVLAALLQEAVAVIPPWQWAVTPLVAVGLVVLWGTADRLARSAAFTRWQVAVEPGHGPRVPPALPVTPDGAPAR